MSARPLSQILAEPKDEEAALLVDVIYRYQLLFNAARKQVEHVAWELEHMPYYSTPNLTAERLAGEGE